MTGGSVDSTSTIYWSAGGGNFSEPSGAVGVQDRADNDGANFCNLDCTWGIPYGGDATMNYEIIFADPQQATYYKSFWVAHWSGGHGSDNNYTRVEHMCLSVRTATALTGINLYAAGTMSTGLFTLYGYTK